MHCNKCGKKFHLLRYNRDKKEETEQEKGLSQVLKGSKSEINSRILRI
jgi:hypothetical protein